MNMSAAVDEAIAPRVIPGSKELQLACSTCTFLNVADAKVCAMCGSEVKPPTHDVQPNGLWTCGACSTTNRKGAKECVRCHVPLTSAVTSAAPSQIFCARCGFLNDGANAQCVQCDAALRSPLAKLGADLRDSTNLLARDLGVSIDVRCPGCAALCSVPPATACLRCGACRTYFASPSVGDATNFHVARLASSLSSSLRGLFGPKAPAVTPAEAPEGRLIALGDRLPRSPLRAGRSRSGSASFRSSEAPESAAERRAREERERALEFARQEQALENMHSPGFSVGGAGGSSVPVASAVSGGSSSSRAVPAAVPVAPQDLVKVEGEIVEL